ncbi:MAG: hypothetical protein JOZ69_10490, partial [Myxococcales bacterium]|nr:hypothetical protein [Myxococcales bacterium]
CLDTGAATSGDCGALAAPDPSCAGAAVAATRCAAFKVYFAPKVAAAAVSCLAALTGKQACDPAAVDGCGRAALAQACPDPSIAQLCAVAGTPCRTSPTDCASTVSGLSAQGKQQIAQCVASGCVAGLYACVSTPATTQSAFTKQ